MKAIVKATHEVVELNGYDTDKEGNLYYYTEDYHKYHESEVELLFIKDYDYWEKLKHQYAGMAMQGMIKRAYNAYCDDCANYENMIFEDAQALLKDHAEALTDVCVEFAHALVEKMKEERKCFGL